MEKRDPMALMKEAEAKLNPSWWTKMTSGGRNNEEAAELFTKAGNIFRKDKDWEKAAEAYVKAAKSYLQAQSQHEAAGALVQASTCYRQTNTRDAIRVLGEAVDLYSDAGRFSMAGKHQKEIAEMYEAEHDLENAMHNFQLAADTFAGESNDSANARSCLLKVATYAAELEDYAKAVEIFEKVASSSLEGLSKWSVKDYFLKAGLCRLATRDLVAMRQALEKYKDMHMSFHRDRECKFLEDLTTACENFDAEAFTNIVVDYDNISPLDNWKTGILAKIKRGLQNEEEGKDDDEDGTLDLK